jgi:serine/threonine-protein kinase
MEYLDGEDLETFLRRKGALDPLIAIDFVLQVCEALAEAHGLGLIHRDISPKNLFVTKMLDERPLVKVLDFGLVKEIGSNTGNSTVFGSPAYLSPEQTRSARGVDERTDIWALGVCLYEMLTGRLPFVGRSVMDAYARILRDPVPPLAAPHVPVMLERVVLKCLEKDRTKRFANVVELARALEACLGETRTSERIQEVISRVHRRETMPTLHEGREGKLTNTSWDSSGERHEKKGSWIAVFAAVAMMVAIGVMQMKPPPTHTASPPPAPPPPSEPASVEPPPAANPAANPPPPPTSSAKPTKKPSKSKPRR